MKAQRIKNSMDISETYHWEMGLLWWDKYRITFSWSKYAEGKHCAGAEAFISEQPGFWVSFSCAFAFILSINVFFTLEISVLFVCLVYNSSFTHYYKTSSE